MEERREKRNVEFQKVVDTSVSYTHLSIMDRGKVCRPLETGIAGIDLIYPIGKGQRQLIIGDKKTGKTQITLEDVYKRQLANSVTYYVMTEKDILGYENESDKEKGNDPTEWTDWGKDNSLICIGIVLISENILLRHYIVSDRVRKSAFVVVVRAEVISDEMCIRDS